MKKLFLLIVLFVFIGVSSLFAQTRVITGTVTSAVEGEGPVPGVTVFVKGTTIATATDINGKYSLTVPENSATLIFTYIGMKTQEIEIAGRSVIDCVMASDLVGLNEVVVTALGIAKDKKALGYSVQDVKGDEITKAKETNVINSLQGRISGAQITSSSGAVGASSRIVIRGVSSLSGNNQPLFVVDGIPIDNAYFGTTGSSGTYTDGTNRGNGAADINPDDIETLTVLKGANASALYGSRASAGVIVITTKKGKKGEKLSVNISNTTTFDTPLRLPDYQNGYGQGNGGAFSYVDGKGGGINDGVDESWGPKLDAGLMIPQFSSVDENGVAQPAPWISHPNNVKNLFEVGTTVSTNVSLTGGSDKSSFRLSFTDMAQNGMEPNTDFHKKTLSFSASSNPVEKLTFSASGNYVNAFSGNQPGYGYASNNIMQQTLWTGRQVDYTLLRDKQYNADGSIFNWNHNYHNNPYITLTEDLNKLRRDRFIGNAMVKYQFADHLTAYIRTGGDIYSNFASTQAFIGDMDYPTGYYNETVDLFREINTDFLVSYDRTFGNDFNFTFNFGGNRMDRLTQQNTGEAPELAIPGIYNVANSSVTPVTTNTYRSKRINSLYAFGQFGYKNAIFLDYSLRNDWSSTLPEDHNSYLYPAVSLSGVVTDLLGIESDVLSFAKLRASWAQVGGDTDPYQLEPTVAFGDGWNASKKLLNLTVPATMPNSELKPQKNESIEFGADMRFFMDRVRLDITYYNQKSLNQIVNIPISGASGYTAKTINAGRIDNKGIEVLLAVTPVKKNDFRWDITFNFSKNENKVVELAEDVEQFTLGSYWSLQVLAQPGGAYGVLYGYDFERDENGNVIFYDGLPSQGPLKALGNSTPDWIGGVLNEFTYKGFNASFLVDTKQGGDLYSMTTTWGRYAGALKETLIGREEGIVGDGVMPDGDGGYVPNTVVASCENFNKAAYTSDIAYSSIFDASYIKLREVKFGYTFKSIAKLPVKDLNISFVGRNLAILSTNVPHIDPETAFSSGNVQGLEFGQLPSARSLGFSIGCKF
ncbi:MAG: SusC/RagA family TonB-linked outer membrane protein [Bacteroidales bacterium]|nr:SusC/RagA family TonB-linked outer membrane protein [Bacteroidales bacterium]